LHLERTRSAAYKLLCYNDNNNNKESTFITIFDLNPPLVFVDWLCPTQGNADGIKYSPANRTVSEVTATWDVTASHGSIVDLYSSQLDGCWTGDRPPPIQTMLPDGIYNTKLALERDLLPRLSSDMITLFETTITGRFCFDMEIGNIHLKDRSHLV
jgi:hypothetical protein